MCRDSSIDEAAVKEGYWVSGSVDALHNIPRDFSRYHYVCSLCKIRTETESLIWVAHKAWCRLGGAKVLPPEALSCIGVVTGRLCGIRYCSCLQWSDGVVLV